jgi:hypothetical protein
MLDRVGHVNFAARDARIDQRLVQQRSRRTDKGRALSIFLIPGLLTDGT